MASDPRIASDPRKKPVRHVLIVDDVPEIGALYRALFRRVPAVHVVSTFEPKIQAALQRLKTEKFDLVITDMRMPDGSGDDVIAAARESLPGCPIVLMSGYVHLATREGLAASLTKPLETEKTLHLLTRILSAARPDDHGGPGADPRTGTTASEAFRR